MPESMSVSKKIQAIDRKGMPRNDRCLQAKTRKACHLAAPLLQNHEPITQEVQYRNR
jgi:hypothetical protein